MPLSVPSLMSSGTGPLAGEDLAALTHSRQLVDLIRAEAAARGGSLSFDRFMDLALYAPGLGYYVAGARKFGPGGDFVTAPGLSPLFGRCLARQCQEVLAALGGGEVLELGAGGGELAADLLDGLRGADCLPTRYLILEPGAELRERQRDLLAARHPDLIGRVHWLTGLPEGFNGVLVANEVMDAMPVSRFQIDAAGKPAEIRVRPPATAADPGWAEVLAPPEDPALAVAVAGLQARGLAQMPGYVSEINLRLGPWLGALAGALRQGLLLLIDYGYEEVDYYRAERGMGTLVCHYRHQAHGNPYVHLGLQDITAHVDFTAVARAGLAAGLELAGYTTQAHFLLALGLDELLAERLNGPGGEGDAGLKLLLGAKRLVMPDAMGERFRVLGLAKGMAPAGGESWRGFGLRDLRGRL